MIVLTRVCVDEQVEEERRKARSVPKKKEEPQGMRNSAIQEGK